MWPCPNHPAEKFTEPGSNTCLEVFLMKFFWSIRQLRAGFFIFCYFMDLFIRGPIADVVRMMAVYLETVIRNCIMRENQTLPHRASISSQEETRGLFVLCYPPQSTDPNAIRNRGWGIFSVFYRVLL